MDRLYTREQSEGAHQPYKLGVALSGGGARGFAHAGALKAIDEAGLQIDVISGVSAGSIVAVLYAAGVKPDAILEMFTHAKLLDLVDVTIGKGGFLRIDKFIKYLTHCLGKIKRLEDLKIPTYINVTNFDEGTPKVFSEGPIGPIVKASCSIPIVILPVRIDGVNYVDGGVVRNLPAFAVRDKCDKLIGVNVSPLMPKKITQSVFSIAMRAYTLMAKANQQQDIDMCDLIVPMEDVSEHSVFKLSDIEKVYQSGYESMKEALQVSGLLDYKQ